MEPPIASQVRLKAPFDQALEAVIAALKQEGFGVLTRMDAKQALKEKLGEEVRLYVILGACNPPPALRALTTDPRIGVMRPCNVTVEQIEGEVLVSLVNPEMMLTSGLLTDNPTL